MYYLNQLGIILIILLPIVDETAVGAGSQREAGVTNFCTIVGSPESYNNKELTVDVTLFPGEHSLSMYDENCKPKSGLDVNTQVILPPDWETRRTGRNLRKLLKHHKPAKVELIGTFESGDSRYGPDSARFRFIVSEVKSVSAAQPSP